MPTTKPTFFFYDLETSGINPKRQRIMQFAGQRTDMDLNPIDEPVNIYVKLSDEVLPEPDAVMITGITPQKSIEDGYSEAEFCKILTDEVCLANTTIVGFNSVRFDDEFLRYTLYRNFYDPYEWAWMDGRSRWDMLDVIRLMRALRPDGINWPVDEKGTPTNRLELLTKANDLDHENAHDALNDVLALISVARLVKTKQPKLFEYLYDLRDKKKVEALVNLNDPKPFVYASGRYESEHEKTTVAFPVAPGTKPGSVLVYDLRYDPSPFQNASPQALASVLFASSEQRKDPNFTRLPIKELSYNRCPAVAPLGVLDESAQERIHLSIGAIQDNLDKLSKIKDFGDRIREAYEMREGYEPEADVDAQLYDGFFDNKDKAKIAAVRAATADKLADFHPDFVDERLPKLLLRYKARNFPSSLSDDERAKWEEYRTMRIRSDMLRFGQALDRLGRQATNEGKQFLLSELQLWAESIVPLDTGS